MALINKLVIYTSVEELGKHAANYPCLVNYNPFERTGTIDDGCGHFANVTFATMDPSAETATVLGWRFPKSVGTFDFDNVELIGFPFPATFTQHQ